MARPTRRFTFDRGLVGKLNKRFAFDKRTDISDDGFGNIKNGWGEQFKVWAGKRYLTGGEGVTAARLSQRQPVIVTIRKSSLTSQITNDWRCRDLATEETFNIRSVTPAQDREGFIDILTETGVADG